MKIYSIILILLMFGCAKPVEYTAQPTSTLTEQDAKNIIEQVFMEQPSARKPDAVEFNDQFLWLGYGVQSTSNGLGTAIAVTSSVAIVSGSSSTTTRGKSLRIYYNSIGTADLFTKRSYYIIRITSTEGREITKVVTYSEAKAHKFINAIDYIKSIKNPSAD